MPYILDFMSDHPGGTDVLTDLLASLRLRAWLYSRTEITEPWRFDFTSSPDGVFHIIGSGGGYLLVPGGIPVPVGAGDVIAFPHGDPHAICDDPRSPLTQEVSLEYQAGRPHQIFPFGGDDSRTVMLCGAFRLDRGHLPLSSSLPPLIHIPAAQGNISPDLASVLALLESESRTAQPGTQSVLRRLTEILFIQIIRAWLELHPKQSRGWLVALTDPLIGHALGLIHQQPGRRWSLSELAAAVTLSRSTFCARFTELVGQPPIRYLTSWRMYHAAQLLATGQRTATVASRLGYDSDVAFRKAFSREIGTSPGRYRRTTVL